MIYTPEATNDFLFTIVGSPLFWVLAWLLVINLATFFLFGIDKWKAKRKEKKDAVRRVPEKTLFLFAALGGSIGALLGMKAWHHKTLHKSFRYGIPAILALQILIPLGLWLYFTFAR
jgi:uncharacterized membrane protein YsdA (DUF1294 family)